MDSKSRLDGALEAVKESPFDTGRWDAVLEMASRESVGKQREIWALVNAQFPSMVCLLLRHGFRYRN